MRDLHAQLSRYCTRALCRGCAALAIGLFCVAFDPALAQTPSEGPRLKSPPADRQPGSPPADDAPTAKPGDEPRAKPPRVRPSVPQRQTDGAQPLERLPATAAEKAKALADLYAHLAAAESEESAKKAAGAIERLWRQSGSATVDLLMGRARKAINEKKSDLAQKFLDRAIALAPEYAEGFKQRALLAYGSSNYQAAVGDLRRTLALEPNHFKAMEILAQIWRETGNKKGAYEVMKQLMDLHPFTEGAKQVYEELKREVDGQGI